MSGSLYQVPEHNTVHQQRHVLGNVIVVRDTHGAAASTYCTAGRKHGQKDDGNTWKMMLRGKQTRCKPAKRILMTEQSINL